MPRRLLKSFMPSPTRIREIKSLQALGDRIHEPNLWHLNRYSASMAFFVGLFVAFIPMPGQMPVAAAVAMLVRCNLPLAVCLVWLTNPVTMPPLSYMAYRVGALILDVPAGQMAFELSFDWLGSQLAGIWQPFLLGSLVCALFFGCLGYFVISMLWRWRVSVRWNARKRRRANR
jgi:uncharacterized protein (DUF2062 family)